MGEVQLHLVVDFARVFGMVLRVIAVAVLLDVGEKGPGLLVVSFYLRSGKAVVGQFQAEIDIVKLSGPYRLFISVISQYLGHQHAVSQIPVLEVVVSVDVGGDSHRGPFEIHSGKRNPLTGVVRHSSAHLGRLRLRSRRPEQQEDAQSKSHNPFHRPKIQKTPSACLFNRKNTWHAERLPVIVLYRSGRGKRGS